MGVGSKFGNSKLLSKNKRVASHLPLIRSLTTKSLKEMLTQFPFVYLKPNGSMQGKGIIRIDRLDDQYMLRTRDTNHTSTHKNFSSLWQQFNQEKRNLYYIIQQGIDSATLTGQPCDFRVHLARVNHKWELAGMVARVAKNKKKIVTNAFSGGVSKHVNPCLTKDMGFDSQKATKIIKELETISRESVNSISKVYPKWSEYGLDIGIDKNGKIWIYEINIRPGGLVFKNLDKESYRRILSLHRQAS